MQMKPGMLSVALVILITPMSGHADDSADERESIRRCDERAEELQRNGAFEEALHVVRDCLEQVGDEAQLRLREGFILQGYDRLEEALVAYEAAVAAGLDSADERNIRKIIRVLAPVRTKGLKIEVKNGPAKVYVKHESYGVRCVAEPVCRLGRLPDDEKTVVWIKRKGFDPHREEVTIGSDEPTVLSLDLHEKPSRLDVAVWPETAQVELNGRVLGRGSQRVEVPAGEGRLSVSQAGYVTVEKTFVAHLGEPVKIRVELPELVEVAVQPAQSELLLDGQPIELVDGHIVLPPGGRAHAVTAQAIGYRDQEVVITEDRERPYRVDIAMVPLPPERDILKIVTSGGLAAISATGLGTSIGLTISAGVRTNEAISDCQRDENAAVWRCPPEAVELIRQANAQAYRAEMVAVGGATALLSTLWAVNMKEKPLLGRGMSLRRKLSIAGSMGIGLAGLGVGGLYIWQERARRDRAKQECQVDATCEAGRDVLLEQAAHDRGSAIMGFAIAGAAIATTALLWWQAPKADKLAKRQASSVLGRGITLHPVVSRGGVNLQISGRL